MNQQPQSNRRGHFWSIILALIIGLLGTAWSLHNQKNAEPQEPPLPQAGTGLTVYLLPAGEGQCAVATCDGKTLLLDGGGADFGQTAVDFLRSRGVQRIDLLASSRVEDAFSGGLSTIVANYPVKTVWNAGVFSSQMTAGEEAFQKALSTVGKVAAIPKDGEIFSLGDAEVKAVMADGNILLLELTYGDTTCIVGCADRTGALEPVTDKDVTVWVSDGERLVCLTEAG